MTKFLGVIPARYGSTRFEGKPLKAIAGKPLLQWVIEGSLKAKNLEKLLVATDDERIADLARRCGVEPVMTDAQLPSGSDRVWAAVQNFSGEVIINIQGDEPLVTGEVLDQLAGAFEDKAVEMATLAKPFESAEDLQSPNSAKIILNRRGEPIYFSRFPIPYTRLPIPNNGDGFGCLKHVGFYGYRREFLGKFCAEKPTYLERAEGLEQLRALWMGAKIKVLETNYDSWGVDTPEDVIRIEKILQQKRSRS
jgi:3-deoxy-manno-octulosonate cytidylyltransferase (CMP-KDO synthetase)